jgi:hypothetical protein
MMKRKIAAIFAADIAGYSRLVAEDEEETLRRLASYRQVTDDFIAKCGGRIFNTAGDAVLAEFPSAVEAVRCAIDIQESLRTRNMAYPPSRQMAFRIGITIGDVVERDGDLLGDGVNIAARLEGLAEVGGICISRAVHEQVVNKLSVQFADIGAQEVKNISDAGARLYGGDASRGWNLRDAAVQEAGQGRLSDAELDVARCRHLDPSGRDRRRRLSVLHQAGDRSAQNVFQSAAVQFAIDREQYDQPGAHTDRGAGAIRFVDAGPVANVHRQSNPRTDDGRAGASAATSFTAADTVDREIRRRNPAVRQRSRPPAFGERICAGGGPQGPCPHHDGRQRVRCRSAERRSGKKCCP